MVEFLQVPYRDERMEERLHEEIAFYCVFLSLDPLSRSFSLLKSYQFGSYNSISGTQENVLY